MSPVHCLPFVGLRLESKLVHSGIIVNDSLTPFYYFIK